MVQGDGTEKETKIPGGSAGDVVSGDQPINDNQIVLQKLEGISNSINALKESVDKKNKECRFWNLFNKRSGCGQENKPGVDLELIKQHTGRFRNKMNFKYYAGVAFRLLVILFCIASIAVIMYAIMGVQDDFKTDTNNVLAIILLVFLIMVFLAFAGFMVHRMIVVGRRYRAALDRLALWDLRLSLNQDNDLSSSKLERELQIIARILESNLREGS